MPFYFVYKLTKFHDESISQTGFMADGSFAPGNTQGQECSGQIGLMRSLFLQLAQLIRLRFM